MSLTSPNPIPSIVPKKRPRPVKSCLTCRSKKLKCDREQPCSQCVKNKHPERCVFDERAGGLADPPERAIVRNKRPNIHTSTGVNGDLSSRPSTIADGASPADENGQPFSDNAIGDLRSRIRRLESLVPSVADSNQPKKLGLEDCLTLSNQHNSAGNLGAESRKEYYGLGNTRSLITLVSPLLRFQFCLFFPCPLRELERIDSEIQYLVDTTFGAQ